MEAQSGATDSTSSLYNKQLNRIARIAAISISRILNTASANTALTVSHLIPLGELARWQLIGRTPALLAENVKLTMRPPGDTHCTPLNLLRAELIRMQKSNMDRNSRNEIAHDLLLSQPGKRRFLKQSKQYIINNLERQWTFSTTSAGLKTLDWKRQIEKRPWFQDPHWKRSEISRINQLLTGHMPTRTHLQACGCPVESTLCRICNETKETRDHLLECPRLAQLRLSLFNTEDSIQPILKNLQQSKLTYQLLREYVQSVYNYLV